MLLRLVRSLMVPLLLVPTAAEGAQRIYAGSWSTFEPPEWCRALSMALDGAGVRCHATESPLFDELRPGPVAVDATRRELFAGVSWGSSPAPRFGNLVSLPLVEAGDDDPGVYLPPLSDEEVPAPVVVGDNVMGVALDLAAGKLYATEFDDFRMGVEPRVVRANLDGSAYEVLAGSLPFETDIFTGIALDLTGNKLYWGYTGGEVRRADLDGGEAETFHSPPEGTVGALAIDVAGGRLYWVDGTPFSGGAAIRSIALTGVDARVEHDDVEHVFGLALDPAGQFLYWSECGATPVVKRARLGTSDVETILAPACLVSLAIAEEPAPSGHAVAIADNGASAVARFDVDTWSVAPIASGERLQGPRGIAVEPGGTLAVADLAAQEIVRVDPASGAQSAASAPGVLTGPADVVVDGEGRLVVADLGNVALVRLAADGESAEPLPFPTGADAPLGVAVEPEGTLLATSGGSASIVRVDPDAGSAPLSEGAPLVRPTRIALGVPGEAFVSDTATDTVLRIDLATGVATPLLPNESFQDPFGVAVDPNGYLLVVDRLAGQLVRVDPRTIARRALTQPGAFVDQRGIAILTVPQPGAAIGVLVAVAMLFGMRARGRVPA